ncbi:hypothetical protein PIB30_070685 [Stylosanthes scabra]|uniref:Uncharacterized protein n=1 Tax=Stylosanthes scabra TaxID=79078 RepID=A0ABU6RP35_9FABA|nr:hypothetical protein [Stylosanthes scabra]
MFRRPHRPHCRQNPSPSLQLQLEVFVPTFITASEVAFVASHSVSPLTSSSSQEHRRVVSISIVPASPSSDNVSFGFPVLLPSIPFQNPALFGFCIPIGLSMTHLLLFLVV